jgi:hypothetical protein
MTAGVGPDGQPLQAGTTYHSVETISEDSSPDQAAEGELLPDRPSRRDPPARPGLPLTEAIGRVGSRLDGAEGRLGHLEIAVGVLVGVLIPLTVVVVVEAVAIVLLWRTG